MLPPERVLPYCAVKLKSQFLPYVVTGYLEEKGHFLHHMMKLQKRLLE